MVDDSRSINAFPFPFPSHPFPGVALAYILILHRRGAWSVAHGPMSPERLVCFFFSILPFIIIPTTFRLAPQSLRCTTTERVGGN